MTVIRFLFGQGWWILWHLSFYFILLVSVVMILLIFGQELKRVGEQPDTPSPGSALVFMVGLGLAFVTLVDASILAVRMDAAWYWRVAMVVGLTALVCVVSFPLNTRLATQQRHAAFWANVAVALAVTAGNLALLWCANGRR